MHHINAIIRAAKVIVMIVPEERRLNVSLLLPSVKFAAVHLCGTRPLVKMTACNIRIKHIILTVFFYRTVRALGNLL